jgi:alginate O-acetyltransferase complex protein AlgJ
LLSFSCSGGNTEPPDATTLFNEWASLARSAEQQETIVVEGREGWLFFGPELRHLGVGKFWDDAAAAVSKARRPEWADPLPAILDFHKQLSEAGVDLVIVPVPPKSIIYPEKLSSSVDLGARLPPRLDLHHQAFYELLRENGVKVLDLTPLFLSNREHTNGPLYCRQDTHWSGAATVLAAEQVARDVRSKSWFEDEPGATIQDEWRTVEIAGDLWRALAEPSVAKEHLSLRFVRTGSEGALIPVESDPSSPVVLLGDSHTLVFHAGGDMHAEGAGLADQLALELGFAVDLVGVRGSGATAARINLLRRAQQTPDYWANKQLVIWCFAAREFTESDGWRIVPIGS